MGTDKRVPASELDDALRSELPVRQTTGIQLRIDKIVGFELFNTRPYHNYETWSDGYRVIGPVMGHAWNPWNRFQAVALANGVDEKVRELLWSIATGRQSELLHVEKEGLGDAITTWRIRRAAVLAILAEDPPLPNQRTRLAVLGYHTRGDGE